jgi:CheY-like chemotaxis protein
LTISKILTEIMGGEITVESTPEVGSTFSVRLFLPDLHGEAEDFAETRGVVGYRGARRRILVVDDQAAQCALMVSLLEPLGFRLSQALSGTECLDQLQTGKYDLILLDINMDGMDGLTLARALRSRRYAGSIIVVSANAYQSDRQRAVAAGCDDFIAKPVRIDQLLGQIQLHLGLDWIYEGEAQEDVDEAAPVVLPDAGPALTELRQWARMGDLGSLTGAVESLAQADPRYEPLATHVAALARDFKLGDLKRLICGT